MSAIIILIGASLLAATGFLIAFIWAVRSGQMDDMHTPALRILWDDRNNKQKNPGKSAKKKDKTFGTAEDGK